MTAPIIDVDENLRLLGTAHVATASVEAVRENIAEWHPDIVAVELCQSRYNALTQDRRLDKEGLLKVIKEGKAPMVLLQSLLAAEQRKLGIDEGQQPGAELLAAVTAAEEAGKEPRSRDQSHGKRIHTHLSSQQRNIPGNMKRQRLPQ